MTQDNKLTRYWLLIGVTALAIAGLFSLVLVVARTPQLANLPLFARLFHEALVVHVDLSVLVWFLSIACLMWSTQSRSLFPYVEEAALICVALGTLAIAASPLDPNGQALMSNYIPVITSPVFFLGLALIFCGVALMLLSVIPAKAGIHSRRDSRLRGNDGYFIYTSAIIALIAIFIFVLSFYQMPHESDPTAYYDLLFWGGGHVLQFLHTQIVMLCWLMLAKALVDAFSVPQKHLTILFSIGLVASLAALVISFVYPIQSAEYREHYTKLMILAGGIAPTVLALWILPGMLSLHKLRFGEKRALWSSLLMSILLFIYGGMLGALITGQNVVIPAHYHGSIVGITLAFMGAAYLFLPKFGYKDVANWRLAYWQPIVYGLGQALHISGLAWSGGYGVLRKTPGGMEALPFNVKAAMGLMGLGGTIAIIGGFMFVIVVAKAVLCRPSSAAA